MAMTDSATPNAGARFTSPFLLVLGFLTNFFDTLGIGSFATTTAVFKARKMVADELIPGTLNMGHALPTVVQAFIYIRYIKVDVQTLVLLIAASVLGAWIGAGIVSGWNRRRIQRGMAIALMVTAIFLLLRTIGVFPGGGNDLALHGTLLVIGVIGNFALGALMTLGIGLYAPCMAMVSLLNMNPVAAFPIMMGSCAFLMPVASAKFFRTGRFDKRAVIGLAIGGIPAVLIAGLIVKELPLYWVKLLVVVVITYTAIRMWLDSRASAAPDSSVP